MPGVLLGDDPGDAALAALPDGRPELAVAIPGPREPWGVLLIVGETRGSLGSRRPRGRPDRGRRRSARSSAAPSAPTRSATCSTAPRPCAGSPATSAAGSTSTASCPAWSTTRWSCSRATARRSSSSASDGQTVAEVSRGLSSGLPRERPGPRRRGRCRPPPSPPAGRSSRSTTATTRAATTSAPPSSRRASTRCARRRCSTAPSVLGLLNIYHDRPHHWTDDELETIAALATQASVAIRAAQDYERMATWAAQLQSIQQLGARLSRPVERGRDRPCRSPPSCAS